MTEMEKAINMATALRDLGYDAWVTPDGRISANLSVAQAETLALTGLAR